MDRPTTTAPSWSSAVPCSPAAGRAITAAVGLALLVAACVPPPPSAPPPTAAAAATAPAASPDPAAPALSALAAPIRAVAEGAVDVARRVDHARHGVARGRDMAIALDQVGSRAAVLDRAVGQLRAAAAAEADLSDPAAGAVAALADTASAAAAAARDDAEVLRVVTDLDQRMDAVVAGWGTASSRSEVAGHFQQLRAEAEALLPAAGGLPVHPAACTAMRDNRTRWAELLVQRTAQLEVLALQADGTGFDALLDRFQRAPYGEDRAAADEASRVCWADHAPLAAVEATVRDQLDTLEQLLVG